MTAYCKIRWQLYEQYCRATAQHYRNPDDWNYQAMTMAHEELKSHHQACDDCKRHAAYMVRLARDAFQPEFTEAE